MYTRTFEADLAPFNDFYYTRIIVGSLIELETRWSTVRVGLTSNEVNVCRNIRPRVGVRGKISRRQSAQRAAGGDAEAAPRRKVHFDPTRSSDSLVTAEEDSSSLSSRERERTGEEGKGGGEVVEPLAARAASSAERQRIRHTRCVACQHFSPRTFLSAIRERARSICIFSHAEFDTPAARQRAPGATVERAARLIKTGQELTGAN